MSVDPITALDRLQQGLKMLDEGGAVVATIILPGPVGFPQPPPKTEMSGLIVPVELSPELNEEIKEFLRSQGPVLAAEAQAPKPKPAPAPKPKTRR